MEKGFSCTFPCSVVPSLLFDFSDFEHVLTGTVCISGGTEGCFCFILYAFLY